MPETLVGRTSELASAQTVLDAVRTGTANLLEIIGEPGVGKSRLLEASSSLATAQGFRLLRAPLDQIDRRVPFAALRLAILPALQDDRSPRVQDVATSLMEALRLAGDRSDEISAEIVGLLANLLDEWTARSPVMFAIDDVHFCDTDTLDALTFCGRHLNKRRADETEHDVERGNGTGVQRCATRVVRLPGSVGRRSGRPRGVRLRPDLGQLATR